MNQSNRLNTKSIPHVYTGAFSGDTPTYVDQQKDEYADNVLSGNVHSACVIESEGKGNKLHLNDKSSLLILVPDELVDTYSQLKHPQRTMIIPKPPRIDCRRLQRFCERRRTEITRILDDEKKKEKKAIETTVIDAPPQNVNHTDIEGSIGQLKEKNTELQEKLKTKKKELETELIKTIAEEYASNKELMMMKIAFTELNDDAVIGNRPSKENEVGEAIPTKDAFNEARLILKRFFEIRNKQLASCVNVEIRVNKIGDSYANMIGRYRTNVALLSCVTNKEKENKRMGYRVLSTSTKLLEKIHHQLRKYDKTHFSKQHNISNNQWNKNIKNYEHRLQSLKETSCNVKTCLSKKEKKISDMKEELHQLQMERSKTSKELNEIRQSFDLSIEKSACFLEATNVGVGIRKTVLTVKNRNEKTSTNIFKIRNRMENVQNKTTKYDQLFIEVDGFVRCAIALVKSWDEKKKIYEATRKNIESIRRKVSTEEEYQTQLKKNVEIYRCQSTSVEIELKGKEFQHKQFSRKLRQFSKQMNEFKYKNCKLAILRYSGNRNTNLSVTC